MPRINTDETYEPRVWRCDECRRVLGVVMRDTSRVRRLWVFTLDIDERQIPPTAVLRNPPKGMFKIHGADSISRPGGVECSLCGVINEWTLSTEAYEKLMSNYPKKVV